MKLWLLKDALLQADQLCMSRLAWHVLYMTSWQKHGQSHLLSREAATSMMRSQWLGETQQHGCRCMSSSALPVQMRKAHFGAVVHDVACPGYTL
eukprot:1462828-Amphidinium_carterae.1